MADLTEFDLDALDHLDAEGLRTHFRTLAEQATASQLRNILGVPWTRREEDEEEERLELIERYVDHYLGICLKLRAL
jgi:hypothetical protein